MKALSKSNFSPKFIFLVLFLWIFKFLGAQPSIKDIVKITNPEVSSFIKFIDFPIDAYTGNAGSQVPVYSIKDGSIDIPITLRYNSSGISVRDEASWVGLGWNLEAGGVITQVAVGSFDVYSYFTDYDNSFWTDNTTAEWNYDNSEKLLDLGIDHCLGSSGCEEQFLFASMGYMQPDVFYFSFLNYSGKFFIDYRDGSIHQLNKESNLKFTSLPANSGGGWSVATEDGMKLLFNQKINTIDVSDNLQSISYYLSEIVYPTGEKVNFQYSRENIYSQPMMSSKLVGAYGQKMTTAVGLYPNTVNETLPFLRQEALVLDLIKTPNFKIDFVTSTRDDILSNSNFNKPALKLDAIEVSLLTNPTRKRRFVFETSYFQATTPYGNYGTSSQTSDIPSLTKRLKLDSFFEEGTGNGKYVFTYNTLQLPIKTSYAVDYWGYYNGQTQNTTLIPSYDQLDIDIVNPELYDYGANRAYDFTNCKAAILTSIKFPTGGSVQYTYEPHVFSGKTIPTVEELNALPAKFINVDQYLIDGNFYTCPATGYPTDVTPYSFTLTKTTKAIITVTFSRGKLELTQFGHLSAYLWSSPKQWKWEMNTTYPDQNRFTQEIDLPPGSYGMSVYLPDEYGCMKDNGYANTSCNFRLQEDNPDFTNFINRGYSYGGGLRVAEVQLYDYDNTLEKKTKYKYEDIAKKEINGNLVSSLSFLQSNSISYKADNIDGTCGYGKSETLTELDYSGNNLFVSPYSSLKGNVGYVKVIEQITDQNNIAWNGYKTYYYTPIQNSVYWREGLPLIPKVGDGLLYKVETNNKNGDIKSTEIFKYDINHLHTGWGAFCTNTLNRTPYLCKNQLGFTPSFICGGSSGGTLIRTEQWERLNSYNLWLYPLPCYEIKLKDKEVIIDGISKIESFTYNNIGQLSSRYFTNSNNDVIIESMQRVGDYTGTDNTLLQMKGNNWLSPIITKSQKLTTNTITTEVNTYSSIGTQYFNGDQIPVYAITQSKYSPANKGQDYIYNYGYSTTGNIEQFKEASGSPVSFFWGYSGGYPVVKAENCLSSVLNEAVLASLPNGFSSMEELLNYSSGIGDMTTTTQKSLWKVFNDNLRSQLSLKNAHVYSYSYNPLFGMTSQTTPNAVITYYEYFTDGKLQLIRDHDENIIKTFDYNNKQ